MLGVLIRRISHVAPSNRARILEVPWQLARRNGLAGRFLPELAREVRMRAPPPYATFPLSTRSTTRCTQAACPPKATIA